MNSAMQDTGGGVGAQCPVAEDKRGKEEGGSDKVPVKI
jgi:hypothetical protein